MADKTHIDPLARCSREIDPGTFVVRVQHHQNDTFQGSITWTEKDKTVHFRSTWEMVRLIEDALLDPEEHNPDPE